MRRLPTIPEEEPLSIQMPMQMPTYKEHLYQPSSIFICLINIMLFMILETLFFWFIVSKSVENVIDSKIDLFITLGTYIPELEQLYRNITDNDTILQNAKDYEILRHENNIQVALKWLGPFYIIIISLVIIYLFILICNRKFDKVDMLLLSTVVLVFSTELLFYFVVIKRSRIIGDMVIIKALFSTIDEKDIQLYFMQLIGIPTFPTFPPSIPTFPPSIPITFPPT